MTACRGSWALVWLVALTMMGLAGCARPAEPGATEGGSAASGSAAQSSPDAVSQEDSNDAEVVKEAEETEEAPADYVWQEPDTTLIQDKPLRYVTRDGYREEWEAMEADWEETEYEVKLKVPLGLDDPAFYIPAYNFPTKGKVELGGMLYFDVRLSADGSVSCRTCHDPDRGFTDNSPVSTGIRGQQGGRSSPTVINSLYNASQFWDGRAPSLEQQALGPQTNPIEMGNKNHGEVVGRLRKIPDYQERFRKTFGTDVTVDGIAKAIASFERTVLSGNSPLDQHNLAENEGRPEDSPLTESQKRGWELFKGKALCNTCHAGFNFTDNVGTGNLFHNVGAGFDPETEQFKNAQGEPDIGRFSVVRNTLTGHININETGAFKTPTLRNITDTAPYMHDGSKKTLADVVEFYDEGTQANPFLDLELTVEPRRTGGEPKKLKFTEQEEADLIELLKALKGQVVRVPVPDVPTAPIAAAQ